MSKTLSVFAGAAIGILIIAGCARGNSNGASTPLTVAAPTAGTGPVAGNAAHGKQLFVANCSSCHGATGNEGGDGPSLTDEKARKNDDQTIAWIMNPQPPMTKLYPSPLSKRDVADLATYVQSL